MNKINYNHFIFMVKTSFYPGEQFDLAAGMVNTTRRAVAYWLYISQHTHTTSTIMQYTTKNGNTTQNRDDLSLSRELTTR